MMHQNHLMKKRKRFDIGAANTFELNQTQTNMQNAETALIISKYDLVFKQKYWIIMLENRFAYNAK